MSSASFTRLGSLTPPRSRFTVTRRRRAGALSPEEGTRYRRSMRRFLPAIVITALIAGFAVLWASYAFGWSIGQWLVWGFWAALAIGAVIRAIAPSHAAKSSPTELSASDAFSDIELGRRPTTHYPHDAAPMSQIGDPPDHRS